MKDEDSTWCGLSSSSSDNDDDEDYIPRKKTEQRRKNSKRTLSQQRQRPTRTNPRSLRLSSCSSSSEDESCPSLYRKRSRKEARTKSISTASIVPAKQSIGKKSSPSSRPRLTRKRPLPRPISGNLSDTSSSSSDDSLLFKNTISLSISRKNPKESVIKNDDEKKKKDCSDEGIVGRAKSKKSCVRTSNKAESDAMATIQDDGVNDNGNNSDSDSDDTAELLQQLARKSAPRKNLSVKTSISSRLENGCSAFPSPKPEAFQSKKINPPERIPDRDNHAADDEICLNKIDEEDKSIAWEDARIASNSNSKPSPLDPPTEEVFVSSGVDSSTNLSNTIQNSFPSNFRFELPLQSSSSEESSDSDEKEHPCEDEREQNTKISNGNTGFEERCSTYVVRTPEHRENDIIYVNRQGLGHGMSPSHDNNRNEHEDKQFLTQTNEDLFETAFGGNNSSYTQKDQHHLQSYIDLVDSDDEQEMTQSEKSTAHQYGRKEKIDRGSGQIFENKDSPRSPNLRKSPKFNIAARNFLHNKPWANSRHDQDEIEEDVIQFEDDDRKLPARPRRVTQDHTSKLVNQKNISDNSNAIGRSSPFVNRLQQSNYQAQSEHETAHRSNSRNIISHPWNAVRSRRMRDPTSSNVSLAASVVLKNTSHGGNAKSNSTAQSTANSSSRKGQADLRNEGCIGDIRTFVTRRPNLAFETRNRAKSIESVRAHRHDIQGHTNIMVVNHPPVATGVGSRSKSRSQNVVEQEDVIEVFDDDEEPVKRPARSRKTTTKAQAKPKRKRTYTRKKKYRKTGGRKRTRNMAGGRSRRYGNKRSATSNDDSGAWGSTGGGLDSQRPVHKEDPAFRNVGAEITF